MAQSLEEDEMRKNRRPGVRAVLENLKALMPFRKKIRLFIRNNVYKIINLRNCCSHPGEPGC